MVTTHPTTNTTGHRVTPDNDERKPFITVVQEWVTSSNNKDVKLNTLKEQQRQSVDESNIPDLSYEQLEAVRREVSLLKSEQEKFLYVCRKDISDNCSYNLLQDLLNEYPNSNWHKIGDKQHSNCSVFHILAQKNKVRCLELLISYGNANDAKLRTKMLDVQDSINSTPLLYAVAHDSQDAVAFLLSKGNVNTNAKDIYNKFPLLLALRNKNYKIAELLLSNRNTDIHLRGTKGNTVLHTMVEEGDYASVKFLVEKGASAQRRNNEEENVLFHSLPHTGVASFLSHYFSKKGLGKMLTNLNTFGQNIFHKVASDGFFDTLLVILGSLALGDLSSNQVHALLNTPDKNGNTPLILAVKAGRRDMVAFLCQCQETNLNEGDRAGNTPLHFAAANKDQELTTMLTKYGASFKASNALDEKKKLPFILRLVNRFKSLSTVLTLMLGLFAIICILSVAAVCIAFFASNISSSASQIRQKSFGEVVDYLSHSVETHGIMQKTAISQIADKMDPLNNTDAFRFVYTIYQSNYKPGPAFLASSSIRLYDGRSVGTAVNSLTSDSSASICYDSYADPLIFNAFVFHNITQRSWTTFDFTRAEVVAQKPIVWKLINDTEYISNTYWSEPYLKKPLTNLFYSLITPLRDPITNRYLGFYALDATLQTITDYLGVKSRDQYDSAITILETTTQYLIASSDPNVTIYTTYAESDGTDITRYTGIGSSDARVSGMTRHIRQKYGSGDLGKHIGPSQRIFDNMMLNGKRHAVNIARITDSFGLDWIVCQSLPTSIFYRTFGISIGVMAALTLVLLFLGIVLSTIAARLFMRPIYVLIQRAEDIKMLQLDKVEKELAKDISFFTEVKSLQESYKSMTARLKQFRQFIPSHILSVIETEIGLTSPDNKIKQEKDGNNSSASHSDHLSVSSGIYSKGMINRALKSKLNSGCVTVMTIRFPDMEEVLEQYSADDLSETTKDLFSATRTCVQDSNGQLVNMTSKKVVIVWNTFISQSDHRIRACRTARQCVNELQKLHLMWTQKHLPLLEVTIGISSGVVYYGNIGSDSTKFFTIIGRPAKESDRLCVRSKSWGSQITVSEDVYEHAREEFYLRPFGNKFEEGMITYELGDIKNSDFEWVEELNHQKDQNPNDKWNIYREGFDFFQKEMFAEALQTFTTHHNKYPQDTVCQKMITQCHDQSSNISTGARTEPDLISSDQ